MSRAVAPTPVASRSTEAGRRRSLLHEMPGHGAVASSWWGALVGVCVAVSGCGEDELFGTGTETPPPLTGGSAGSSTLGGTGGAFGGSGGVAASGGGVGAHGGGVGASGGGVGASGGGGEGGSPPPEDCTNGVDDDGDGSVDCADTECADFGCVEAAVGAVAYLSLDGPGADCPAPTALALHAACEDCECSPTAGSCHQAIESYAGADCTDFVNTLESGVCANTTPDGDRWFLGTVTVQEPGSCDLSAAEVPSTDYYGCEQDQVGVCGGSSVCVSNAIALGRVCALLPGEQPCPAIYPERHVVWPGTAGICSCECAIDEQCEAPHARLDPASDACSSATVEAPITAGVCSPVEWSRSFFVPWLATEVTCELRATLAEDGAHTLCCQL